MYLQLAENNNLSDQCGLPPLKPFHTNEANSRKKNPAKWAEYDRKKKEWDDCRIGKGKATSLNPLKSLALAPGRALFLAMLDMNVDGLASRLATENIPALSAQWNRLGGDSDKLIKFINEGKGKPKKNINFLQKFAGNQGLAEEPETEENPAGVSADQKKRIMAAATAAGVAISAAIPAVAPVAIPGGPILGTVIIGVLPFIKNAADKTPSAEKAGADLPAITIGGQPLPGYPGQAVIKPPTVTPPGAGLPWMEQTNFTGMSNKTSLIVAGNGIAIFTSAALFKKNKKKAAAVVLGVTAAADIAYYFYQKQNP